MMLKTVDEIVRSLGGTSAAAAAMDLEPNAVSMWKSRGKIPPDKFMVISDLLLRLGHHADPAVFFSRTGATNE